MPDSCLTAISTRPPRRALQQHHAAITARGARLVAISPQVPDGSLTLTERHALTDYTSRAEPSDILAALDALPPTR
ncbi:hypothetical protein [Streptomyces sp. NPDC048516]|uniref:hypothetical protein n=1 Tax=Streptomyces sp. NPDC048516 TaxID=3365565 RepID=UPI0037126443